MIWTHCIFLISSITLTFVLQQKVDTLHFTLRYPLLFSPFNLLSRVFLSRIPFNCHYLLKYFIFLWVLHLSFCLKSWFKCFCLKINSFKCCSYSKLFLYLSFIYTENHLIASLPASKTVDFIPRKKYSSHCRHSKNAR